MKMLKLADNLSLPWSIVHERLDVLGVSGSGKTTTMLKIFELLYETGSQVIYGDSVGNAYSLRSAANGTDPGIAVPVFGGDHGDMPLPADGGAKIARALVELETSAVLDISDLDDMQRVLFVRDFANAMLKLRKARRNARAMHMLFDEAYDFAPEKAAVTGEAAMTAAVVRLLKKIRNYGGGWSLSTQDAQSTSKRGLNQARTVIAHQLIAEHDRAYLKKWVGTKVRDPRALDLLNHVSELKTGEALVFSPALKFFDVVKIAPRWTFDLKPPEVGEVRKEPKKLAAADMKHLRELLADVAEPSEEEAEPAITAKPGKGELGRLRVRVRHLEAELKKHPAAAETKTVQVEKLVEVPALSAAQEKALTEAVAASAVLVKQFSDAAAEVAGALSRVKFSDYRPLSQGDLLKAQGLDPAKLEHHRGPYRAAVAERISRVGSAEYPKLKAKSFAKKPASQVPKVAMAGEEGAVNDSQLRMLALIGLSQAPLSKRGLGIFWGSASASGYFRKQLGPLVQGGLVSDFDDGLKLTAEGKALVEARRPDAKPKMADARFKGLALRFAQVLAAEPPITKRKLGLIVGINATSGYFRKQFLKLEAAEYINESGNTVTLCPEARQMVGDVRPIDLRDVLSERRESFTGLAQKLFDELARSRSGLSKTDLGNRVGVDAASGYFRKQLAKLDAKDLLDEAGGIVKLADELFAESRSAA